MSRRNVAILIFDDVEILDFAGPYEVFATTRQNDPEPPFFVYTVAEKPGPVAARNGLSVNPRFSIHDCPNPDIVLVPGGRGTRTIIHNQAVLDWIEKINGMTELTLSVCTGALLLGKAGLLDGLAATTYHTAFEELRAVAPDTVQRPGERWVDNGRIVTSAGVSAGIDMSLYVVGRLLGAAQADETARYMEYEHWRGMPAAE
jgi:transcriptional regulator GlxA family with amidase domain